MEARIKQSSGRQCKSGSLEDLLPSMLARAAVALTFWFWFVGRWDIVRSAIFSFNPSLLRVVTAASFLSAAFRHLGRGHCRGMSLSLDFIGLLT